ncbi:MAG: ABC transporter permease [Lachnospiraceae bacterium]|nr:ABC transporter permease [Lachnospiraceae bacterium]
MRKILLKRIPRELKANLFRYISLYLLIVFSLFIVVSIVDASERIIVSTKENQEASFLEDGQVTVFTPLTEDQLKEIEEKGVTIEEHFSFDTMLPDGSSLRIFKVRDKIDLIVLDEGSMPEKASELVLEKRYAACNQIKVGDVIFVGDEDFIVTGIGSTVDYDAPYRKLSDVTIDSHTFGTAFLTEEGYEELQKCGTGGTQDLTYAFRLNDTMTANELKEMIRSFPFDYKQVDDPYYQEILADTYGKKDEITDGINELVDGVEELKDGVAELKDGTGELKDGMKELSDGGCELYDGSKELKDGTVKLNDGVSELSNGTVELYDGAGKLKDGIGELKNGLWSLHNGADALNSALNQLKNNNGSVTGGAEQIMNEMLRTAQDSINAQLVPMGMPSVSLTAENYGETLNTLAKKVQTAGMDASGIQSMKDSLDGIAAYVEGTKQYTNAVAQIADGSGGLSGGSTQAAEGTGQIESGAAELQNGIGKVNEGVDALKKGTIELSNGAKELSDGAKELKDGIKEAYDGTEELDDGVVELKDGVDELFDGVKELKEESDEMLDKIFDDSPDNITAFMLKAENIRIGGAAGDVEIDRYVGMMAGVIVMVLFTYVLSVFVIHQIQSESSVIGAMYSLGVKKRELIEHYISLPTIVCFLGGMTGGILGMGRFGSDTMMADSFDYFSLPWARMYVPTYLIVYSFIMPPVVSIIVNYLVINKNLSRTALSLLRNEQKVSRGMNVNLRKLPFLQMYQLRQLLRETRTAITVFFGMFISLMVFMLGMDCYVLCESAGRLNSEDVKYQYMYTYKYPTEEVPEGGEAVYIETLKKEQYGYNLDITVMGIDDENPYFNVKTMKGKNKIIASDAVAARYNVGVGDKIIFSDTANDIDYAFTVEEIVPYSVGLTVFMDIDSMRELFDEDDDYYNVVMADHELDIEEGRLYSVTSKADIDKASGIFLELMQGMFTILIVASVVIFCLVMYLMMAVMVDRAGFGISLLKIFGYRGGEIKKLYLDGNRLIIIVGALLGVPAAKLVIDKLFPSFVANVACALHLEFKWYFYVAIFAGIYLCYTVINLLLMKKLNKVSQTEVLKNRE